MESIPIPTEQGTFVATFSERGLSALDFPKAGKVAQVSNLLYRRLPACKRREDPERVEISNGLPIGNRRNRSWRTATMETCATAEVTFRENLTHWTKLAESALTSLLNGQRPSELPPLDISAGTQFQQNVWKALQAIPLGATATYSEVARQLGKPAAVRAVGRACGANPIPVLIPCHRVLAKGSKLGGFSAGLDWKRILLAREGIHFVEQ